MKTLMLFPFAILLFIFTSNHKYETTKNAVEISITHSNNIISLVDIVGEWKKTAGGEDVNKNRILEESEKIKNLQPGAQDNLHFFKDGKCKIFGMGMELEGTWRVKTINGKKMILFNDNETPANAPQEEKDQDAMKFEIVSEEANKLVLIPPIYTFMLAVYERSK